MADIPFGEFLKASQLDLEDLERMSPQERVAYDDLQRRAVFGHDSKVDHDGVPIEQGIGSSNHPSRNSIEAYKRWHSGDADFDEQLKKMEAAYAEYVAARRARRAA